MLKHLFWIIAFGTFIFFSPALDVIVTSFFYSDGHFVHNIITQLIYRYAILPALIFGGIGIIIFVGAFFFEPWRKWRSLAVCMILTLGLGSGAIIHGLKDNWGRPRPVQTQLFGGEYNFRPCYLPNFNHTEDEEFKSFPCGHVSMGFFFLSFVMVGRRQGNDKLVYWGWLLTVVLGVSLGLTRIAQGKHFLSDVVVSFVIMYFVAYGAAWVAEKTSLSYKRS